MQLSYLSDVRLRSTGPSSVGPRSVGLGSVGLGSVGLGSVGLCHGYFSGSCAAVVLRVGEAGRLSAETFLQVDVGIAVGEIACLLICNATQKWRQQRHVCCGTCCRWHLVARVWWERVALLLCCGQFPMLNTMHTLFGTVVKRGSIAVLLILLEANQARNTQLPLGTRVVASCSGVKLVLADRGRVV